MKIVIPMAGKSRRFFEAGYTLPKMLLPVGGRTMIEEIVDLFNAENDNYLFVISESDNKKYNLSKFLRTVSVNKSIYIIKSHNLGPAYSLLQISDKISPKEEVIVNYCDFLLEWDYPSFLRKVREWSYSGGLVSFKGFHPASLGNTYYAYMRVNDRNELLELREKICFSDNRVEEHASTGTYYFKKWEYVLRFGRKLIDNSIKAGNEYYPSLIYNYMNDAGLKSLVFEADKFICLGTPEDYEQYKFWFDFFKRTT